MKRLGNYVVYLALSSGIIYTGYTSVKSSQATRQEELDSVTEPLLGIAPESFEGVTFVKNYDADTLMVNIPAVPNVFGYHIRVRLSHVDSPEITSTDSCSRTVAVRGRELVANMLSVASQIDLLNVKRDKYFRLLAEVRVSGVLLHEYLLERNLVVPYEGGPKPKTDWCAVMNKPSDAPPIKI